MGWLARGSLIGLVVLGGEVCLIGYRVQWFATVVEQPAHRTLFC